MAADIIISDLSLCQPQEQLDRGYRHGTWRLIDYETDEFAGTMVYSGPGMASPPLTLSLGHKGYHAIFLGTHYPGQFGDSHVRVRLSDDPAYTLVVAEQIKPKDRNDLPDDLNWCFDAKPFRDYQTPETFWKVADLTDQNLIISRANEGGQYAGMYSNLVHVRLVPLTDEQVAEYKQELPREDTRCLIAMNDGGIFSDIYTREDIWAQLEPYRDSDVGIMLWAFFKGQNCTYRSRIGRKLSSDGNPFDRFDMHETWDKSLRSLEEQGVDFLSEVVEAAHAMDLRIFSSLRMMGAKPVPVEMEKGNMFHDHPEFRARGKDGRAICQLSMAFPEVRQLWIDLLCETLEYGFDGVHVIFCRSHPFVLYDEPVIRRFHELYGEDPRHCPEDDPRFYRVLAEFVTQFARELKAAVDAEGQKQGRRIEIAFSPYTTFERNLQWGVDVETFVKEGLVDYLLPHPAPAITAHSWMGPFVELVKDTPVKLCPDMYPRRMPAAASLYSAQQFYELGCDGIAMWDTYARVSRISEWAMMKRLGHREEIKSWRDAGKGDEYFNIINFKWLGDRSGDPRYFQTNG